MKAEYEGEKAVALTCKTYFCEGKSKNKSARVLVSDKIL